jgi:hypothetical protein
VCAHALLLEGPDLLDKGGFVGELAGFQLRVDEFAVYFQLEAAPLGRDERE